MPARQHTSSLTNKGNKTSTLILLVRRRYTKKKTHEVGSEMKGREKCSLTKIGMVTSLTNRTVVLVKVNRAHQSPQTRNLEEVPAFYTSQILQRARYNYNNYSALNFRPPAWAPDGKHVSG